MRQSWVCPVPEQTAVPLKRISLFILSRSLRAGLLTSKGSSWPGSLLLPPLRLESSVLQALTKTQPPSPPTTQDFPSRGFPSAWSTELNCFLSERERGSLSNDSFVHLLPSSSIFWNIFWNGGSCQNIDSIFPHHCWLRLLGHVA